MGERTSEYWQERFRQLEESQHDTSVQTVQEIEQEFRRAEQALDGKINAWYQRFAANNGISMVEARRLLNSDELEEFRWDVQDYIKYGRENGINQQWAKQLENASAKVHISRLEALKVQTQQEIEKLYGNYTMDLIYQTLYRLRTVHHFNGYIHVKAIPGADPALIEKAGFLADRMSINLELPTANGLKQLAPCKSRHTILSPMRQIQNGITENQNELMVYRKAPKFVPAGQSTQMIIGATPENDYQIMRVSEALYEKFHLKRVFYSAFINVNGDSSLPVLPGGPPLLREHRLYQADWLLRYYRFHVDELLSEDRPNFNIYLDPKCDWALRHLDTFPVEINRASYQTLLRVPGIGYKSAQRIVAARRDTALTYDDLKKIGVVLKRALYFITCSGRMMYRTKLDEDYICSHLMADHTQVPTELRNSGYQQLSLFDTGLAL